MIEQLDPSCIRIIHPECGSVLLITDIEAVKGIVLVEGICYRCDRYVFCEIKTRLNQASRKHYTSRPIIDGPPSSFGEIKAMKKRMVLDIIKNCDGNVTKAARKLNVAPPTLYSLLHRWGVKGLRLRRDHTGR